MALVALAAVVVAGCAAAEGTVVAKTIRPAFDYTCEVAGMDIPTGNGTSMHVPIFGTCTEPECLKLSIHEVGDDPRQAPDDVCVTADEYQRLDVGSFYHQTTD